MEKRKPNSVCNLCETPCYVRPSQKARNRRQYCSWKCYVSENRLKDIVCTCGETFHPRNAGQQFCSIKCASSQSRNPRRFINSRNTSRYRLRVLEEKFGVEHCMVSGCKYDTTYDIHRLIPGKDGGKYEIGNMFAICPNHHAEVTRGIIALTKINDHTLESARLDEETSC